MGRVRAAAAATWGMVGGYIAPVVAVIGLALLTVEYPRLALYTAAGVLMLSAAALLHEGGHYVAARRGGITVTTFSVGFGPPLWSHTDQHGTTWALKAVPVGGAVTLAGTTVEEAHGLPREHTYIYAPLRRRTWVAAAGVVSNMIAAWAAFSVAVIGLAPADAPLWKTVLLAPILGLVASATFLHLTFNAVWAAIAQFTTSSAGSILVLPESLADGATSATTEGTPLWAYFTLAFGVLNVGLAVFNTLPLYPLDGSHLLVTFLDYWRMVPAKVHNTPAPAPLTHAQTRSYRWASGGALAVFTVALVARDLLR